MKPRPSRSVERRVTVSAPVPRASVRGVGRAAAALAKSLAGGVRAADRVRVLVTVYRAVPVKRR